MGIIPNFYFSIGDLVAYLKLPNRVFVNRNRLTFLWFDFWHTIIHKNSASTCLLLCISVPHVNKMNTLSNHCYQKLLLGSSHFAAHHFFKTNILNSRLHHHTRLQLPTACLQVSSKPSLLASLLVSKRHISKFCAKKLALLLLVSLIFMGSLKSRPVLAVPVQEIERFGQRRETRCEQNSDGEEEVMCLKLLLENPTNIEALKMVVNVKMKRGKTNEAVEFVEMLIEQQPNEMEWRLLLALCYEMMGNLVKAKSLFQKILKQKPLLLRALHVRLLTFFFFFIFFPWVFIVLFIRIVF